MISSSQDLLFLVLAFCVLWITIFLCWALYYLIAILRDAKWAVEETREKVEQAGRLIDTIEEKVHSSGTYIGLIARAVTELVDQMRRRREPESEETAFEKPRARKKA